MEAFCIVYRISVGSLWEVSPTPMPGLDENDRRSSKVHRAPSFPAPNSTRADCLEYICLAVAVAVHCSCWNVLRVIVECPNELASNEASLAGRLPNGHLVKAAGAAGKRV